MIGAYDIAGRHTETCDCSYLWPCGPPILSARPGDGDCKVAVAMRTDRVDKDGVDLPGTSFVVMVHVPKALAEVGITVGPIVEGRALGRTTISQRRESAKREP